MVGSSINNLALSIKAIWKVVHYTEPTKSTMCSPSLCNRVTLSNLLTQRVKQNHVFETLNIHLARGSLVSYRLYDAGNLGALFLIGGTKVGSRRVTWCCQVVMTTT